MLETNLTLEKYRSGEVPFFRIQTVNHTEERIFLKFNFTEPEIISRGIFKDEIICEVLQPEVFKSKETLKSLIYKSDGQDGNRLATPLPPISQQMQAIQDITTISVTVLTVITSQNFFVSLLL